MNPPKRRHVVALELHPIRFRLLDRISVRGTGVIAFYNFHAISYVFLGWGNTAITVIVVLLERRIVLT